MPRNRTTVRVAAISAAIGAIAAAVAATAAGPWQDGQRTAERDAAHAHAHAPAAPGTGCADRGSGGSDRATAGGGTAGGSTGGSGSAGTGGSAGTTAGAGRGTAGTSAGGSGSAGSGGATAGAGGGSAGSAGTGGSAGATAGAGRGTAGTSAGGSGSAGSGGATAGGSGGAGACGSGAVGGVRGVTAPDVAAAPVFGVAGSGRAPAGLGAKLDRTLGPVLGRAGLGTVRTGQVLDVASGTVLYDHSSGTATTPASTTKLATAVAAIGVLGDTHTLTTSVVAASGGRVVLVGGGDPTLELGTLAADTAAALRARGTTTVSLGYDTSYFTGPLLHPIGYNENLAPVSALMVREGRLDHSTSGPAPRSTQPAWSAAQSFAELLRSHGVTVTGSPQHVSGARGTRLAVHESAPVGRLVERMLTNSDNDIAEALAREVARATGRPASFAGGSRAIAAALRKYGVPLGHSAFVDGSGLSHADALSPATLTHVLALAASPSHPELRPVLDGLPIAAFTGTLASRFAGDAGAGVVRAKTGTLTGTNTIAGLTTTRSGRVLAFSFMLQGTQSPPAAEAALDTLASTVSAT